MFLLFLDFFSFVSLFLDPQYFRLSDLHFKFFLRRFVVWLSVSQLDLMSAYCLRHFAFFICLHC